MQVIILAAGRGTRLGAKAQGLPKCLLQVGGQPLAEHQLKALAEAGASPVLMVVGHAADLVEETLRDRVETILNPRFAQTNSLYSLCLAKDWVRGPVLVMNSDLLFDREVVERLVKAGPDHLLYDSSSAYGAEPMKVRIEDGVVRDISKELPREAACGESLGMIYLSEASIRRIFERGAALMAEGRENVFWAEALRQEAQALKVRGVDVAGLSWIEIDSPYDLDRARRVVWPAIERRSRVPRPSAWMRGALAVLFLAAALFGLSAIAPTSESPAWDVVAPEGGTPARIVVNDFAQDWVELDPAGSVALTVSGPRKARVDLRGLVPSGSREEFPYAIEAALDGATFVRREYTGRGKPLISHPRATVCDRDKLFLDVPPGRHRLALRLASGNLVGLLVRLRLEEDP